MKSLKTYAIILTACVGLTPTAHAQWLRLFPAATLKQAAPLAASIRRAVEPSLQNAVLGQATTTLAQTNFIKDILRQDATPEEYMPQIDYAKRVYLFIDFLHGTDNSLSVEIVQKLSDLLHKVTLMSPVTRQVWISTLQAPYLSSQKYPVLLKQMREYYGFGTEQDVEVLAKTGKLIDNPMIQLNHDLYQDFTTRLEQFVQEKNRIPQEISGISGQEEIELAREYKLLQHVNGINNFNPIRPYIKRIDEIIKTVK